MNEAARERETSAPTARRRGQVNFLAELGALLVSLGSALQLRFSSEREAIQL